MGIGITSNYECGESSYINYAVSIPNGDRHYLEHGHELYLTGRTAVSIPNGDRHYLEPIKPSDIKRRPSEFQSPMGIGITSNYRPPGHACPCSVFQSPMGIGITSNATNPLLSESHLGGFNPQWG